MSRSPEQSADIPTCAEKKEDLDPEKVHSANSWESVDMGDDDRKKKFLRLMGASKTEHSGRFVIGDKEPAHKHGREKADTEKLNRDLEDQFLTSKERRVNRYNHKGLGFDDEPQGLLSDPDRPKVESDNTVDSSKGTDPTASGDDKPSEDDSKPSSDGKSADLNNKRESDQPDSTANIPPKKPKMMMNFVKASD